MSAPGKLQKLKKYLEDNGLDFPDGANHGTRANKKSKSQPVNYFKISSLFRQRLPRKART